MTGPTDAAVAGRKAGGAPPNSRVAPVPVNRVIPPDDCGDRIDAAAISATAPTARPR
jgi:hypothetical protein